MQKHFIIKADDYARIGSSLDPWRRFADTVCENRCIASVGVVAEALGTKSIAPSIPFFLRSIALEYQWEIWNHSLAHKDITGMSRSEIELDIKDSQARIEAVLGSRPRIFGPPFNLVDEQSSRVLQDCGEFDGYYFVPDLDDPSRAISQKHLISVELSTATFRPIRHEHFIREITRREYPDFLVLQVHPYYWTQECFGQFDRVLRTIGGMGYQSISGADRIKLQAILHGRGKPAYGRSLGESLAAQQEVIDSAADKSAFEDSDSSYYLRVVSEGWSQVVQFLAQVGFGHVPVSSGANPVFLDVGAGTATWAAALSCLHPDATVLAIDREGRHLQHVSRLFPADVISAKIGDFDAISLSNASVSGIVCNNALSYMPIVKTMAKMALVLVHGGLCFIGIQNRLYPIHDALRSAKGRRIADALGFIRRLLLSEAYLSGILGRPTVVYLNQSELGAMGALAGLKLQRSALQTSGFVGAIGGSQTFSGHLMVRTDAIARYRSDVMAGGKLDPALSWLHKVESSNSKVDALDAPSWAPAIKARAFARAGLTLLDSSSANLDGSENQEEHLLMDEAQLAILDFIKVLKWEPSERVELSANRVEDAVRSLREDQLAYWL